VKEDTLMILLHHEEVVEYNGLQGYLPLLLFFLPHLEMSSISADIALGGYNWLQLDGSEKERKEEQIVGRQIVSPPPSR
jgi:hypothetical protein